MCCEWKRNWLPGISQSDSCRLENWRGYQHMCHQREGRPQGTSNPKCAGLLSCCWGGRKPQLPWQRPPPGPMANSLQGDVTQQSWVVEELGQGWISDPHQHLREPSWTHTPHGSVASICLFVSISISVYVILHTHTVQIEHTSIKH